MAQAPDLSRLVPGFDFLQSLMKNAGAGMPGMGQWVAPTLNPEEIDKRIQELRTVQFWLEQNARLLATTIQALEVQRMTLSTLQSMNLPMADLRDALTIRPLASAPTPAPAPPPTSPPPQAAVAGPAPPPPQAEREPAARTRAAEEAPPAIDPMQWWSALTQQFTELATQALRDTAAAAPVAGGAAPAAGPGSSSAAKTRAKASPPAPSGASRGRGAPKTPTRRRSA